MNSGCSESPQQALLHKKWYNGKESYIEFKSDMTEVSEGPNRKLEHKFEWIDGNKIRVISKEANVKDYIGSFQVKDSVLLLVSDDPNDRETRNDSVFYLLSDKYEQWQSKQIFIYGKVVTEKEPLPYIKFEF